MTKHTIGDNRPAPEPYMISAQNEHALSEVIGFILIIVIIITAFSLYLTYAVPAQGRENEIRHMDEVKDELVGFKIGVDSLWTNQQTESLMSTTLKMGTAGATTQGSNGFLPVIQPVGSSGTVTINQRTSSPEWLNISSYSYITNQSSKMNDTPLRFTTSLQSKTYTDPPDNLVVNITVIKNLQVSNCSVNLSGTDRNGVKWQALINVTPRKTFYLYYFSVTGLTAITCPQAGRSNNGTPFFIDLAGGAGNDMCMVPMNAYNYTGTDLTLTIYKNNTQSFSNLIVYDVITANKFYEIDLLDPTFGLSSNIQNTPTISFMESDPAADLAADLIAKYAYQFQPKYAYNISLGALEYRAENNYWIPQTYYYQLGGIFLSQSDGVSSKVPPAITFKYNPAGSIRINILGISIGPENSGSIGGTSPIQIGTKILSDSGNLPYAPITNNTMNVTINFTSSSPDTNTNLMWEQFFKDAANRTGGIPNEMFEADSTANGAYIIINGFYKPPISNANTPDINLNVQAVNLSARIQSMSGV